MKYEGQESLLFLKKMRKFFSISLNSANVRLRQV